MQSYSYKQLQNASRIPAYCLYRVQYTCTGTGKLLLDLVTVDSHSAFTRFIQRGNGIRLFDARGARSQVLILDTCFERSIPAPADCSLKTKLQNLMLRCRRSAFQK